MAYGSISVDQINNTTGYSLGAGNASLMKNRLINGAMVISQRNGTTATSQTNGSYNLDRWYALSYDGSLTTGKYTVAQSSTAPTGFTKSLLVTSSAATSSGSSDAYIIGQAIEGYNIADLGWGTANAKTVTLSFWVRSSVTGTFGAFIRNAALDYSYPTTYTISSANAWEYKTITIAGPTSGTWPTDNSAGLYVWFQLQVGSSLQASPNAWTASAVHGASGCVNFLNTNGATIYFTGVQLEVGNTATGYEYRQYGQELALCQRYFWRKNGLSTSSGAVVGSGFAYNTTDIRFTLVNPVVMRTTPTATFTGSNFEYEKTASSRGTLSSLDVAYRSPEAVMIYSGSGTTSTTAGQGAIMYIVDPASYISISAEL